MDWTRVAAPSLDDIETLARAAFAALPAQFRALTEGLVFMVEDFPSDDVIKDMALESPFDILGLFHGADLAAQQSGYVLPGQTMIFLYRRPILEFWAAEGDNLGDIVRHVLIHEIGHHFGLSDAQMEALNTGR